MVTSRFDSLPYDNHATELSAQFKEAISSVETVSKQLPEGRAKSILLTKLEEALMWANKAVRDDQILRKMPKA